MHVTVVLDTIKKHGHFNNYDKAQKAHDKAKQAVESVKAGLALLNKTSTGEKNRKKKALAKAKKAMKEALVKVPDPKSEAKAAEEAPKVTDYTRKLAYKLILRRPSKPRRLPRAQ